MIYVYNSNFKNGRAGSLIGAVFSIILGALITLLSVFAFDAIVDITFFMIGMGIILSNIFPLITAIEVARVDSRYIFNIIASIIGIILGVLFMFNHSLVVSIVFGVYLVIMPTVRIILSKNKLEELKSELPLYIAAILLFCNVLDKVLRIGLIVVGVIITILGIINLAMELIYRSKHKDDNDGGFNGFNGFNDGDDTKAKRDDSLVIDAEVKDLD